mmetsp:Transcript_18526/g.36895  ORF Transcript_18526/g.36895 Transcript_18526/m.36895 type:complete len:209 (-) Transcript_18526:1982-2608(-)
MLCARALRTDDPELVRETRVRVRPLFRAVSKPVGLKRPRGGPAELLTAPRHEPPAPEPARPGPHQRRHVGIQSRDETARREEHVAARLGVPVCRGRRRQTGIDEEFLVLRAQPIDIGQHIMIERVCPAQFPAGVRRRFLPLEVGGHRGHRVAFGGAPPPAVAAEAVFDEAGLEVPGAPSPVRTGQHLEPERFGVGQYRGDSQSGFDAS